MFSTRTNLDRFFRRSFSVQSCPVLRLWTLLSVRTSCPPAQAPSLHHPLLRPRHPNVLLRSANRFNVGHFWHNDGPNESKYLWSNQWHMSILAKWNACDLRGVFHMIPSFFTKMSKQHEQDRTVPAFVDMFCTMWWTGACCCCSTPSRFSCCSPTPGAWSAPNLSSFCPGDGTPDRFRFYVLQKNVQSVKTRVGINHWSSQRMQENVFSGADSEFGAQLWRSGWDWGSHSLTRPRVRWRQCYKGETFHLP